ncbi:MAG: endonuclease III [Nitrospinota bacterium]
MPSTPSKPSAASKRGLMRLLAGGLRRRFGVPSRARRAGILDTLIQTLLSQSTTDHNRDLAFGALKRRFKGWDEVAAAPPAALAQVIRPAGLGNQKAGRILGFLRWLKGERGKLSLEFLHDFSDAEAVALLTRHKGIGVKTAYVTLMLASARDLFPVDVHIHRIARRLGLIGPKVTPEKAHGELGPLVPKGRAHELHLNLLAFGRTLCTARNPKCGACGFRRRCAFYRAQGAAR